MKYTRYKSNVVAILMRMLPFSLVAAMVLVLAVSVPAVWAGGKEPIEFDEAEIFFEFNSTDNDLGIQIFFDAEGWKEVEVQDPEGEEIFEVENDEGLKKIGSTEVFTESAEPELDENNLEEDIADFQAQFPEGTYYLKGKTVTGKKLEGEAELAYELPTAPIIKEPTELPDGNPYVIEWTQPDGGPEIIGYEVVAELVIGEDELTLVNTGMFLAGATEFTVSPEFVDLIEDAEDTLELVEFKVEVIARAENLNKTITESVIFSIEDEE